MIVSKDDGATWKSIHDNLGSRGVTAIVVSDENIVVGVDGGEAVRRDHG